MKKTILALVALLLLCGCQAQLITQKQLSQEIDAVHMSPMHMGVHYCGSDSGYHYFAVKFKLHPNRFLKVTRKEIDILGEMALSRDETDWRGLLSVAQGESREGYSTLYIADSRKYLIKDR